MVLIAFSAQEMSMTGSENEEETTRTPEKLTEEASKAKQDVTVSLKPCAVDLKRCYSPTCMLGLLRRPELLPAVLEFEKTMLVIKEHSYARAPDRPEVLQLSNIHAIDLSSQDEDANTLLNARTDLLQLRESIGNERSEPSVVGHLRQVVGLQVALIRDQQEQLYEKDRDMNAVKKEKEQASIECLAFCTVHVGFPLLSKSMFTLAGSCSFMNNIIVFCAA